MSFYRLFILFYDRIRSGTIAGAKNLPDFVFPKLPLGEGSGESETILANFLTKEFESL